MKRLTSRDVDELDARALLEDAITKTCALLEVLTVLRAPVGADFIALDMRTLDGLTLLSQEQSENLRCRFEELVAAGRLQPQEVTAAR